MKKIFTTVVVLMALLFAGAVLAAFVDSNNYSGAPSHKSRSTTETTITVINNMNVDVINNMNVDVIFKETLPALP
jgi:YbbR domain-containing protein